MAGGSHKWTRQPVGGARIDCGNALTRGMTFAWAGDSLDRVRGAVGRVGKPLVSLERSGSSIGRAIRGNGANWLGFGPRQDITPAGTTEFSVLAFVILGAAPSGYICGRVTAAWNLALSVSDASQWVSYRAINTSNDVTFPGGAGGLTPYKNRPLVIVGTTDAAFNTLYLDGIAKSNTARTPSTFFATNEDTFAVAELRDTGNAFAPLTDAVVSCVATWRRTLTASEVAEVSRNPWQLFKSTPRTVWYEASAGAVQIGVPISTISAGAWTPVGAATIHEALGSPRNDAIYAKTNTPSPMEVGITVLTNPVTGDKFVRYTLEGTGTENCDVSLIENGSTTVQTWNHTNIGALTLYEPTVTGTLTNAGTMSLRFAGS